MKDFIQFVTNAMTEQHLAYEKRKEQILKEYRDSMNLPRKKKKQRRKELNIDWNLNEYTGNLYQL